MFIIYDENLSVTFFTLKKFCRKKVNLLYQSPQWFLHNYCCAICLSPEETDLQLLRFDLSPHLPACLWMAVKVCVTEAAEVPESADFRRLTLVKEQQFFFFLVSIAGKF